MSFQSSNFQLLSNRYFVKPQLSIAVKWTKTTSLLKIKKTVIKKTFFSHSLSLCLTRQTLLHFLILYLSVSLVGLSFAFSYSISLSHSARRYWTQSPSGSSESASLLWLSRWSPMSTISPPNRTGSLRRSQSFVPDSSSLSRTQASQGQCFGNGEKCLKVCERLMTWKMRSLGCIVGLGLKSRTWCWVG